MRILLATNFYLPHRSGLVTYVENLGAALVQRGHEVTVLCAHHDSTSPARETHHGMTIIRTRVVAKPSKGVVSPQYLSEAWRQLGDHDVVAIQLPQLEASALSAMARRREVPVVLTYQCDVTLPAGGVNGVIGRILDANHRLSARMADKIVVLTLDYARHSRILRHHLDKVIEVRPPVDPRVASEDEAAAFRSRLGIAGSDPVVGICARLSAEKGFDRIIDSLELLQIDQPDLRIVHVGDTTNVPGEAEYSARIGARLKAVHQNWISAGQLSNADLSAFYRMCDLTLLPSVNGTEAYGIVQVESLYNGTPVVASDLPGVRAPVSESGMGLIVPTKGARPLADAVRKVLADPEAFATSTVPLGQLGSIQGCADAYEEIFGGLVD